MKCNVCGAYIEDGTQFCGNCGTPVEIEKTYCQRCGSELRDGDSFCPKCGASVDVDNTNYNVQPQANPVSGNSNIDTKRILQIAGIAVLVLAVIIAVVIRFGMNGGKKNTETTNTSVTSQADIATPAPTKIPAPIFTMANASSMRGTDTEGGQYSVESVLSKDPMTKWVPQKNNNGGINEWIQVSANGTQYVKGIEILNGYHKSSDVWKNNNRVRLCTITFSNGETREFVLNDTMELIRLDLGETIATTSIRLTIKSVYNGIKWDDTAITYLGAY